MTPEHDDFYKRLRKKVQKWARSKEGRGSESAEFILLAPDLFHLLVRLTLDKDVAVREKAKLGGAIAYFLSPIDLLPEWLIGPIGYLDDVGLAVYVIHSVLEQTDEEVVTRHWAGDRDLLETIQSFMARADRMLGSGLWGRLKSIVESPASQAAPTKTRSAEPARSDAARATEKATGTTEVAGEARTAREPAPKRANAKDPANTTAGPKKATAKAADEKASGTKPSEDTGKGTPR